MGLINILGEGKNSHREITVANKQNPVYEPYCHWELLWLELLWEDIESADCRKKSGPLESPRHDVPECKDPRDCPPESHVTVGIGSWKDYKWRHPHIPDTQATVLTMHHGIWKVPPEYYPFLTYPFFIFLFLQVTSFQAALWKLSLAIMHSGLQCATTPTWPWGCIAWVTKACWKMWVRRAEREERRGNPRALRSPDFISRLSMKTVLFVCLFFKDNFQGSAKFCL